MDLAGNTVLITGGASGIGFSIAERFSAAGSKVIICGRREEQLRKAQQKLPSAHIRVCDVSIESDRTALHQWIAEEHPHINMLVNNTGIQQRFDVTAIKEDWGYFQKEIQTNLEAPIHLSMLFIPLLAGKNNAAIVNVSSGLAFTPGAFAPIYSATKAGLHSFTMSLRQQVAAQHISVIEVAPPAVNSDLGGAGLHTFGVPLDEFADAVFLGLANGDMEIGYGTSQKALRMSRDEIDEAFRRMNSR